jgi:hypothetical protein
LQLPFFLSSSQGICFFFSSRVHSTPQKKFQKHLAFLKSFVTLVSTFKHEQAPSELPASPKEARPPMLSLVEQSIIRSVAFDRREALRLIPYTEIVIAPLELSCRQETLWLAY